MAAATRNLFMANTPLVVLECAAAARRERGRAQLVLLEDFDLAPRLEKLLRRWRDNPFEQIVRLPGRHEEHRRGPGAQRGIGALARRIAVKRDVRRETMALLREIDARFEPQAVWVGNDKKVETQYALHLASKRTGTRAGRYLDDGLHTYLGRFRERPLVRRVDELVKRIGYGRWATRVPQIGTSPWIAEGWVAFPAETVDQDPARARHALARDWFTGRDFRRLSILAAREFLLEREALDACSVVVLLPHSKLLRGNQDLLLTLRRLAAAADACGRRVAIKYHPRERESDPFGLLGDGLPVLVLPKLLPMELMLPLLPSGGLLVGEGTTAVLAAQWLRPDLAVRDLGTGRGDYARRARALFERHGVRLLDETALGADTAGP
jgi:hypothetical protein